VIVGTVDRPVGLRGEVEVRVHSDDPRRFRPGSRLLLEGRPLTVAGSRRHHGRTLVRFEEVGDRERALGLRGRDLVVPATQVRALGRDEYWDDDLVGCEVRTIDGRVLGRVTDVIHGPVQDVLEVGEVLVPLVAAIVRDVYVAERRIVVDPPPGLVDDGG
jgi:16S rRNA processing protein RimM